ncbi:signal peptidase II [Roseicella aquatilis]|uniref:Lipoprotein signal peptidase n=1 Tax=Roseicella aquatilis TaxID=2527868 RepID=A0A4R4D8R3_9PROT|nr:signal peptidase II [Roseicella aquatilis]TCZ55761.1 signal peptidase II [Roseicella aquatilis]
MQARPSRFLVWGLAFAALAFAIDQATKAAALATLALARGIEVLPFFNLVLVHNRGVTFGLLANDHPAGRWLLILLTGTITVALLVWLRRAQSRTQAAALGLIIGGALGNLADRLRHGAVTDFLDFHAQGYHWPAFNLADSGIVLGVALLLIAELRAPSGGALSRREA